MWTKTVKVKFQNNFYQVQIWLENDYGEGKVVVKVQSMLNEYFLGEEVIFENRDSAYAFIKYYPKELAKEFLIREAYSSGAIN